MVSYIEDQDVDYVGVDHEMGRYIAGEHPVRLGYERIGYVHGETGNVLREIRFKGFKRALKEYGKKIDEKCIYYLPYGGELNYFKSRYEIVLRFPELKCKPEAIFLQ